MEKMAQNVLVVGPCRDRAAGPWRDHAWLPQNAQSSASDKNILYPVRVLSDEVSDSSPWWVASRQGGRGAKKARQTILKPDRCWAHNKK